MTSRRHCSPRRWSSEVVPGSLQLDTSERLRGRGTIQLSRTGAAVLGFEWALNRKKKTNKQRLQVDSVSHSAAATLALSVPATHFSTNGTFMGTPPSTTSGARNVSRLHYVRTCPEWCTATSTCPPDCRLTEYRRRLRSTGALVKVSRESPRPRRFGRHMHGSCQQGLPLGRGPPEVGEPTGVKADNCTPHKARFVRNSNVR